MSQDKLTHFLQSRGIINSQQAAETASQFTRKSVVRHDFLLREGKVCDEYFFLDNGLLRAFACNPAGNDVTTGFYRAGEIVFEVSSFFTRVPSQENIQALTNCDGWFITFAQLNALFHARTEFGEFGRLVLVAGVCRPQRANAGHDNGIGHGAVRTASENHARNHAARPGEVRGLVPGRNRYVVEPDTSGGQRRGPRVISRQVATLAAWGLCVAIMQRTTARRLRPALEILLAYI